MESQAASTWRSVPQALHFGHYCFHDQTGQDFPYCLLMHATCFIPIFFNSPVDCAGVQASLDVLGLLRHLTNKFCKRGKATRYNNRAKRGAQNIDIHSLCEARELVCVQAVPEFSRWNGLSWKIATTCLQNPSVWRYETRGQK